MNKPLLLILASATAISAAANSPYIATVYDFCPAPGQFVNEVPEVTPGMTRADVIAEAGRQLVGDERPGMISLGAFGGYVVFGFDHPVVNVAGQYDFKIYGNAFKADQTNTGGSSEPGIVMVSVDTNGDGIPNDEWYELKGSETGADGGFENFTIIYQRPSQLESFEAVKWTSNEPGRESGVVDANSFHTQSYWPLWLADSETLEFTGHRLPDNGRDRSGNGSYWVLDFFEWGYVDNLPDYVQDPEQGRIPNPDAPGFNIENAIDAAGNPVALKQIDFIKVYTAMNQMCGHLGETSTELCGGRDLHPDASSQDAITTIDTDATSATIGAMRGAMLGVSASSPTHARVYSPDGHLLAVFAVDNSTRAIDLSGLRPGIAIVTLCGEAAKVLIP